MKSLGTGARSHSCAPRKAIPGLLGRLEGAPWNYCGAQFAQTPGGQSSPRPRRPPGRAAQAPSPRSAGPGLWDPGSYHGREGERRELPRGQCERRVPRPRGRPMEPHPESFSSRTSTCPGPSPLPRFVFVIWGPCSEKASAPHKRWAPQNPPTWLSGGLISDPTRWSTLTTASPHPGHRTPRCLFRQLSKAGEHPPATGPRAPLLSLSPSSSLSPARGRPQEEASPWPLGRPHLQAPHPTWELAFWGSASPVRLSPPPHARGARLILHPQSPQLRAGPSREPGK